MSHYKCNVYASVTETHETWICWKSINQRSYIMNKRRTLEQALIFFEMDWAHISRVCIKGDWYARQLTNGLTCIFTCNTCTTLPILFFSFSFSFRFSSWSRRNFIWLNENRARVRVCTAIKPNMCTERGRERIERERRETNTWVHMHLHNICGLFTSAVNLAQINFNPIGNIMETSSFPMLSSIQQMCGANIWCDLTHTYGKIDAHQ